MANKKIIINVSDNVSDALVKSFNKRIAMLEKLIAKKSKKKDTSMEMAELRKLRGMVGDSNRSFDRKSTSMIEALKAANSRPFTAQIVPSPS